MSHPADTMGVMHDYSHHDGLAAHHGAMAKQFAGFGQHALARHHEGMANFHAGKAADFKAGKHLPDHEKGGDGTSGCLPKGKLHGDGHAGYHGESDSSEGEGATSSYPSGDEGGAADMTSGAA